MFFKVIKEWITDWNATFTLSPKMSNNGDPEARRYKPEVLKWHNSHEESCFKFVINEPGDLIELQEKYIDTGFPSIEKSPRIS